MIATPSRVRMLLAVLAGFCLAIARAEEQTIVVPGEGWRIVFDGPRLTQRPFPPGIRGGVYSGIADKFQLTFFVDRPWCEGPDTHENLYACFVKGTSTNPYVLPDSVRGNTTKYGVQTMTFSRMRTAIGTGTNMAMHLLFARNGKWADFHASMASPTADDAKALFAIMESIRVEDDPTAPAAVPDAAASTPMR